MIFPFPLNDTESLAVFVAAIVPGGGNPLSTLSGDAIANLGAILQENGDFILQENGDVILQEVA